MDSKMAVQCAHTERCRSLIICISGRPSFRFGIHIFEDSFNAVLELLVLTSLLNWSENIESNPRLLEFF
jgi:hypothetical protein